MSKLTDADYRLPKIQALSGFEIFDKGATKPMGVRGVDMDTGVRGQFVVKFVNATRMSAKSSCRELIGAWMANELEIFSVEPVLVYISKEFTDTLRGQSGFQSAMQSVGYNFGSVYKAGFYIPPVNKISWDNNLIEQAKRIFMFDMFIANTDRGHAKPNVLYNGDNLFVFDHELAFSFINLLPLLRNKTPWIFGDNERELYNAHYFFSLLRGNGYLFDELVNRLTCFNTEFWNKALHLLPEEWKSDELVEIRTYCDSIIENRSIFSEQLTKILAS